MHQDRRGYWYRSKREGGRVVKEYVGRGVAGEVMAQLESLDRQSEALARVYERAGAAEMQALDREVKAACDVAAAAMSVTLEDAGYRLHARSQWRKKRARGHRERSMKKQLAQPQKRGREEVESKVNEMFAQASSDPEKARQLVKQARESGIAAHLEALFGDMAAQAWNAMKSRCLGEDHLALEATESKMETMRAELSGPHPPALESLLVERVMLCWFYLHYRETIYIQQMFHLSMAQVEHHQKQIDRAQKRYLASIKALAQVRRLQLPSVQVNIGEKQVNIAQVNGAAAV
jgi:hypothetical protein